MVAPTGTRTRAADPTAADRTGVPAASTDAPENAPSEEQAGTAAQLLASRGASAAPPDEPRAPGVHPSVRSRDLAALQRSAGNRAVASAVRTVQRDTAVKDPPTTGGGTSMQLPTPPVALEVLAGGIDEAASVLAKGLGTTDDVLIFGLTSKLMIVYGKEDDHAKRLSGRIGLEFPKGIRPAQGVFVIPPGKAGDGVSHRVMKDPQTLDWSIGDASGIVDETAKPKAKGGAGAGATDDKGAPTTPPAGGTGGTGATGGSGAPTATADTSSTDTPAAPKTYSLRDYMTDKGAALDAAVAGHEKAWQYFVVPTTGQSTGKKKGGAGDTTGFSGELSEGGDGPPANAPPWPVNVDGPKMAPTNATSTFEAKINWGANGNNSTASQVISQVGTDIHYRWEKFDVTAYAKKNAAQVAARARETQAMIKAVEKQGLTPGADPTLAVAPDPTITAVRSDVAAKGGSAAAPNNAPGTPATTGSSGTSGGGGVSDITPTTQVDDYQQQLDTLTHAKSGSGEEETGAAARNKAFKDDFKNLYKDTARSARDLDNKVGDTAFERVSNAEANLLNLELLPVSALVTSIGATLRWFADVFAGERKQMDIPWDTEGTYLVRVITTPRVGSDKEGNPIIRPSSVASAVIEVVRTDRMIKEALDAPGAELSEAETALKKAQEAKNPDQKKIEDLQAQVELKRLEATGDPLALLDKKIEIKTKELKEVTEKWEGKGVVGPILKVKDELEILENRRNVYLLQESRRTDGKTVAPPTRINAQLISEVTGQTYPLLLSVGPMAKDGTTHHWKVLDATSQDSEGFDGYGPTESVALRHALDKFGAKAQFGRGTIGVRLPASLPLEQGAQREFNVESQPAGWAIARGRIDDLVMTLAALGLFVASAGTGAAVIGAAVAAARLIERLHNGTLRLDGAAVSDALAILGGAGVLAQAASAMRIQRLGRSFVMLEEGGASVAELQKAANMLQAAGELAKVVEIANEAINYAGVIWGNLSFLDQMMEISAMEASNSITHADARRQRAMAIGGAVNNNGMFVAANAIKAHEQNKAAKAGSEGGGAEPKKGGGTGEGGGTHEGGGSGGGTEQKGGTGGTGEGGTHEGGGTGGETKPVGGETKPTSGETTGGGSETKGTGGETGTGHGGTPAVKGGGGAGGDHVPGGTHEGTGSGPGGGGQPGEGHPGAKPTVKEVQESAHKALSDAAKGNGDLKQAAADAIGKGGTWKEDLAGAVGKLEGDARAAAEKALVEARDTLVEDTWKEVRDAGGYGDLQLENAGTKAFASDIDATIRPKTEATATGEDMGNQVKRAAEAAQKLSKALREKVGGETDAKIDTNIYSFIGEGRVAPSDPKGVGAQQHVDMMVGLAEQMRGQSEQQFKGFEQRLGKKLQSGGARTEAKQLLSEAREFHDRMQEQWKGELKTAREANKGAPEGVPERVAREKLLADKKAELGQLLAAPEPDYGAIMRKQAEINWFAPDAYATPSAFKQAVAHGQRLRGSQKTAGEMTGGEVAGKLREAAAKEPPGSNRGAKLARDAALVESQQRLLEMTTKELAREQEQAPMDAERVKELEQRAQGLRDAIKKAAEPVVIGEILGTTVPAERPSAARLSDSAAASGANLGMLEQHVNHAHTVDGKVKAAAKYAGRIAMAEFLGGLRPSSEPIARLIGEFVKSRMGVFEDPPSAILRDMFLEYAKLTGRSKDVVNNKEGAPIGVTDALKQAFVDDVRQWATATNDDIQTAAIGAKAFDNPSEARTGGGSAGTGEPATGTGPGPGTGGGGGEHEAPPTPGATTAGEPGTTEGGPKGGGEPEGTPAKPTAPAGGGGTVGGPDHEQAGQGGEKTPGPDEGIKPGAPGAPTPVTSAGGVIKGGTPAINPPGVNKPFDFKLASLQEGHAALRQLARGDGSILAQNGVQLPAGYESHGREFGLAHLPDGTFVIVQGEVGGVEWSQLPEGSIPLAHTHPMTEGRQINRPGTVGEIATRTGTRDPWDDKPTAETLDRVHVFPSAADLRFCAANKVVNHDVHTPYVHTGDGVLKTPTGASNELPVSFNIAEARHVGNIGTQPVLEAGIVAHDSEGNVLFIGRMWAAEIGGDSVVQFEPFSSMTPPEPKTLDPSRIGYVPPVAGSEGGAGEEGPAGGQAPTGDAGPKAGQGPGGTTKAGTSGGGKATSVPGGVTVTDDGYAIWVKSKKDPNALVRIEKEGDEIHVKDIYRRDLPEGSGSVMLAEGLKAAEARPGKEVIVGEVLNVPTKAAYDRGDPPNGTPLAKTTERALAAIGLTVKSMEWSMFRGKLRIKVKIG